MDTYSTGFTRRSRRVESTSAACAEPSRSNTRIVDIPGGEQIVKESYAQLRKFNCWNISIVHQYARFKESRIRSAVFGNGRQFFLMRQNDRSDLDDMAKDIALPEVTKEAIMRYPLPDQKTQEKYASFTYLHTDAQQAICGTVNNVLPLIGWLPSKRIRDGFLEKLHRSCLPLQLRNYLWHFLRITRLDLTWFDRFRTPDLTLERKDIEEIS